ncbi:MAG: hypothetical protein PHX74_02035 [Candidatus Sumerlaeales bacterium]|nr:hypothetical protein [Candidatus Sumerlaeales bacterium]
MAVKRILRLQNADAIPRLSVSGYTTDIILCRGNDGTLYCTKSGDLKTMDRDGGNVTVLYNFSANGYPGYNVLDAIMLPSNTMIVALTNYDQSITFMRSTDYTTWAEVHTDWNGHKLYHGWDVAPDGTLYAGEYPTHANILTVRLWKVTNDGQTWAVAHTWNGRQGTYEDEKTIFHIHTVCRDPYTGLWWIGCGDNNAEPAIYKYDGTTLTLIGEGTQLWRSCSFAFSPDYVYWGTDGAVVYEGETTCVMVRLDKATETEEIVFAAGSTMFNCELVNAAPSPLFVACGTPNLILLSRDGQTWYEVYEFPLNPALPDAYSWFYDYVDNQDGRIYGYITGILRHDTQAAFTHGTVILNVV